MLEDEGDGEAMHEHLGDQSLPVLAQPVRVQREHGRHVRARVSGIARDGAQCRQITVADVAGVGENWSDARVPLTSQPGLPDGNRPPDA